MGRETDRNRKLADYLYKDLRAEEVAEMEQAISGDPAWADAYRLNKEVKDYLQARLLLEDMKSDPQLEDAEMLADLAFTVEPSASPVRTPEIDDPAYNPSRKNRKRNRSLTAVALVAAVALVLTLGILPANLNEERLFDRYYQPFAASDYSQRGSNQDLLRQIAIGINHYLEGNYQQSIDQFAQLGSRPGLDADVQLFSALSYLGLGQYAAAQEYLESVIDGKSRYQAEALWYLSLTCLKTGDYEKAEALLGQLSEYDGLYQKDSQILRKKVRRLNP